MAKFTTFTMKVKAELHDHSPQGHRAFIATALDQVKHAVASGVLTSGDITVPPHIVVGSWQIKD